jgi:hypothetical protein
MTRSLEDLLDAAANEVAWSGDGGVRNPSVDELEQELRTRAALTRELKKRQQQNWRERFKCAVCGGTPRGDYMAEDDIWLSCGFTRREFACLKCFAARVLAHHSTQLTAAHLTNAPINWHVRQLIEVRDRFAKEVKALGREIDTISGIEWVIDDLRRRGVMP